MRSSGTLCLSSSFLKVTPNLIKALLVIVVQTVEPEGNSTSFETALFVPHKKSEHHVDTAVFSQVRVGELPRRAALMLRDKLLMMKFLVSTLLMI